MGHNQGHHPKSFPSPIIEINKWFTYSTGGRLKKTKQIHSNVLVVFSDDSARTVESIEGECGNNI